LSEKRANFEFGTPLQHLSASDQRGLRAFDETLCREHRSDWWIKHLRAPLDEPRGSESARVRGLFLRQLVSRG
jgi:hypothetical protein